MKGGKIGDLRHVNCVFGSPLEWLFDGPDHSQWNSKQGTMLGNGMAWGQLSHTFAWVYKTTGLTPAKVYSVHTNSKVTGADVYDSIVITCTNGATISASGVGAIPDQGFKVVGNWIFGTEGML